MPEPRPRSTGSARVIAVLALLALLGTAIVAARATPLDPERSCCDMLFYRSMAYNLVRVTRPELNTAPPAINFQRVYDDPYFGEYYKAANRFNRQPPYVYRPAAPLVARALAGLPGVDIERAFRLLAFGSVWATAFLTGLTILTLSGQPLAAAGAVVTVSALYRITAYHFVNSTMVDPLAFALIAVAIWLMFTRRDRWLVPVAALGLFTKETFALVLVSYALLLIVERRREWRVPAALGGVVGVYLAYRLLIPIPNNTLTIANTYIGPPGIREVLAVTFAAFGPLAAFAATRVWFSRPALILSPLLLGLLPLAMLTPDRERLVVYALPALVVAVFAHPVANRPALAALLTPAVLTFAYTQRAVLTPGLSLDAWRVLTVAALVIIEPFFLTASGLWKQSPLARSRRARPAAST